MYTYMCVCIYMFTLCINKFVCIQYWHIYIFHSFLVMVFTVFMVLWFHSLLVNEHKFCFVFWRCLAIYLFFFSLVLFGQCLPLIINTICSRLKIGYPQMVNKTTIFFHPHYYAMGSIPKHWTNKDHIVTWSSFRWANVPFWTRPYQWPFQEPIDWRYPP